MPGPSVALAEVLLQQADHRGVRLSGRVLIAFSLICFLLLLRSTPIGWQPVGLRTDVRTVETMQTQAVHGYLWHEKDVSRLADGDQGTADYRLRYKDSSGNSISPWHDIPLYAGQGVVNALIEIPKMTRPKMEVATKEPHNPIAQDIKNGKLREYHGPIYWNYGMLPQTWEDPGMKHPVLKCTGDNDPLDVVEIGSEPIATGTVEPVKVLGAFAMIDDGELDWKVIAIRVADPLAAELNCISDVNKKCRGTISGIREWFRWYKAPDGKVNTFGFEDAALDKDQALQVIKETHEAWRKLHDGSKPAGKLWIK